MNLVGGSYKHAKDEDGMEVDAARVPGKKRKWNDEREDEADQAHADDEEEEDDEAMRPRKKVPQAASHSPGQTQRKSLASRLQEKGARETGQSPAKTWVKKSKPKEKVKGKEGESDSPASEVVRVMKRRSGRFEVQVELPRSRVKKGKDRVEQDG